MLFTLITIADSRVIERVAGQVCREVAENGGGWRTNLNMPGRSFPAWRSLMQGERTLLECVGHGRGMGVVNAARFGGADKRRPDSLTCVNPMC